MAILISQLNVNIHELKYTIFDIDFFLLGRQKMNLKYTLHLTNQEVLYSITSNRNWIRCSGSSGQQIGLTLYVLNFQREH